MHRLQYRAWGTTLKNSDIKVMSGPFVLEDICNECGTYNGPSGHTMGESIIMQNIGLQDRKGKDIYEGDIVRYVARQATGKVHNTKRYRVIEYRIGLNTAGFNIGAGRERSCRYEVVGNIYENPELITL